MKELTREEAIEILQAIKFIDDFEDYSDRLEIAIDMAIEALKDQRPHGEWEKKPICYDYFYCSGCGYAYKHAFNFCPNCGLPMNERALEILRKRKRKGGKK